MPDRIEFDLTSAAKVIPRDAPAQLSVDGHFLYGAPASNLDLTGTVTHRGRQGAAGLRRLCVRAGGRRGDGRCARTSTICRRPTRPARRASRSRSTRFRSPRARCEATITVSMAESGGRAVERKLTLPIAPDAPMIGVKPAFSGRSLADGANADFDVVMAAPDGKTLAQSGLRYELLRGRDLVSMVPAERQMGIRAGQAHRARRQRHGRRRRRQAGADFAAGEMGPLPAGSVDAPGRTARSPRSRSMPASMRNPAPTRPTCLEIALDKADYKSGDAMNVAVTARTRRPPHAQRVHRSPGRQPSQDVKAGQRARAAGRRQGLGHRRLSGRHAAPSARRAGAAHAGPRHRRAVVLDRPVRRARSRST